MIKFISVAFTALVLAGCNATGYQANYINVASVDSKGNLVYTQLNKKPYVTPESISTYDPFTGKFRKLKY